MTRLSTKNLTLAVVVLLIIAGAGFGFTHWGSLEDRGQLPKLVTGRIDCSGSKEVIVLEPGDPIPFPRSTSLEQNVCSFMQFLIVVAIIALPPILVAVLPLAIIIAIAIIIWKTWKRQKPPR